MLKNLDKDDIIGIDEFASEYEIEEFFKKHIEEKE